MATLDTNLKAKRASGELGDRRGRAEVCRTGGSNARRDDDGILR